ncbi:MAG TPA: archease [Spirochaetota bacterium]|nr:archease [Spirochaetota bacterium]
MSPFQVVDHTADIAVVIEGDNEEQLLREGTRVVFFLLTDSDPGRGRVQRTVKKRVKLEYRSFEELFIDFLNRLLSLADIYGLLPVGVAPKIKKNRAVITVRFIHAGPCQLTREIKAATHHNYSVERGPNGLLTKITFDV